MDLLRESGLCLGPVESLKGHCNSSSNPFLGLKINIFPVFVLEFCSHINIVFATYPVRVAFYLISLTMSGKDFKLCSFPRSIPNLIKIGSVVLLEALQTITTSSDKFRALCKESTKATLPLSRRGRTF